MGAVPLTGRRRDSIHRVPDCGPAVATPNCTGMHLSGKRWRVGRQELPGSPDPNEQFQRALTRPGGVAAATRATRVLRGVGAELAGAENPHSASNDVWLLPGYCLRMARRPGEGGLLR